MLNQQDLFVSGKGGYFRYRIPALAVTNQQTLLAFCEARKYTGRDTDQIDLILRRSFDGGRSFADAQMVATEEHWVCGNPAPVVDRETGIIWLLFCKNKDDGDENMICQGKAPRTVWLTSSADDGTTWTTPREITSQVKPSEWSWYATGPCHGIQLHTGRLLVPCDHIVFESKTRDDPYHSHLIFSDDHGESWQIGGSADEGTNESVVLESEGEWIYFNCRNKYKIAQGGNYRAVAWSRDGGLSFSPTVHDAALPEPICQGSVCRVPSPDHQSRVVFSNPGALDGRHALTIRLSTDECRTWPVSRVLHEEAAAYSDLCVTEEGTICCFYEGGKGESPYDKLILARFDLEWLMDR